MKNQKINFLIFFFAIAIAFTSCNEDGPEDNMDQPIEITANNDWIEDVIESNVEIWIRVNCEDGASTAFVEWAELDNHGEDRNYTGDVMVSAYQLDGITPYFEDKDNGFGDKSKSFNMANNETAFLVKVVLGETATEGTFAIRSTFTSEVSVEYIDLAIADEWTEAVIDMDQIIGYKVKYDGSKKLMIIWAEIETPEEGYSADINVSVLKKDGLTPYQDVEKGKDMLNKNKSHSDDPKYVQTDEAENNLKVHVFVNNETPGNFAIKVVEVE